MFLFHSNVHFTFHVLALKFSKSTNISKMNYFVFLCNNVSSLFLFPLQFLKKVLIIVTTTSQNPNENETLNLSTGSQDSHISHISSILPKHVINSVINEEDDPLIKNLIDEEFRNLECAEKEKEKRELEIKREAKEKTSTLWKKLKAIEEQKAAEEKLKQQRMREEVEA